MTERCPTPPDPLLPRAPLGGGSLLSAEPVPVAPVAAPTPLADQLDELARLPASARLVRAGGYVVYGVRRDAAPQLLREVGRLREIAFRAVGEGSGNAIDLDPYDDEYFHLVCWHTERQQVVGAYRIRFASEALADEAGLGLYTATLFDYAHGFFDLSGPAVELGRSFIRVEAQRTQMPLLLLWKAIGVAIARAAPRERIRVLIGATSISAKYSPASWLLMMRFLTEHHRYAALDGYARPLTQWRVPAEAAALVDELGAVPDTERALSAAIRKLEPDGKELPVLLRQYLRMGARVVAFNIDHDFGASMDVLTVFDLDHATHPLVARCRPPA